MYEEKYEGKLLRVRNILSCFYKMFCLGYIKKVRNLKKVYENSVAGF